jgi:hypothetical protein
VAFTYLDFLRHECGYRHVRMMPDGRWAGTTKLIFTTAIIVGKVGDLNGYQDRWCYRDESAALAALNNWNGVGEPTGWHRHPASGRRVSETGEIDVFY